MKDSSPVPHESAWFLEGVLSDGRTWVIPLSPLPFCIGRQKDLPLALSSPSVSRRHAEIDLKAGGLAIRDLGSTNGTFVNRQRISAETPLRAGDLLHVGEVEFRVGVHDASDSLAETHLSSKPGAELPRLFPREEREFLSLLETGAVAAVFQPIFWLRDGALMGYEANGRGAQQGLSKSPEELFRIAQCLGRDIELSRLFRVNSLREAAAISLQGTLFLNLHPSEVSQKSLRGGLSEIRGIAPERPITLEICEKAVVDLDSMRRIREELKEFEISLAYDDFGAGQTRLLEIGAVPPDVLKFDLSLVKNIHAATGQFLHMVQMLVRMAKEMGVTTLAEGVESPGDAEACADLGFDLGQGFHLGMPLTAAELGAGR